MAGLSWGQGLALSLVDHVPKIALALIRAALGRYPIRAISPFCPSGMLVVDNVARVFYIMGDLQGLC